MFAARVLALRTVTRRSLVTSGVKLAGTGFPADPKDNVGGLGVTGRIPSEIEQSTGIERKELLEMLEGSEDPFGMAMEPKFAPRGTKESPRQIPSHFDERLVGICSEDSEMVHYFTCTAGKVHFVNGEYFELVKVDGDVTP